ncbi:hypothetical protein SUGI_1114200 [Cryptomeria japonica]|nr:hypothetical protein SUGI_1114200 [Cryptomeria japonica]
MILRITNGFFWNVKLLWRDVLCGGYNYGNGFSRFWLFFVGGKFEEYTLVPVHSDNGFVKREILLSRECTYNQFVFLNTRLYFTNPHMSVCMPEFQHSSMSHAQKLSSKHED